MSAPLCKLCEHQHWPREPHVFAETSAPPPRVTHSVTHKPNVTHTCVTHTSNGAARQARYRAKDPAAYRKRHREYVRKRRSELPGA